jgi:hypothetical protein
MKSKSSQHTTKETPKEISVLRKEEEAQWLRDEILKQIDWQQALLLVVFFGGGTFLSLGLQLGVSGLTAMIFPIAGLALALKLSAHDLRTGQINFYMRFILRSPWEICRRTLFSCSTLSDVEQAVLREQDIITQDLIQRAQTLTPPIADMQAFANRLAFLTIDAAALSIGVIRTYPAALQWDPLTILVWVVSLISVVLTMIVLRRKRVR